MTEIASLRAKLNAEVARLDRRIDNQGERIDEIADARSGTKPSNGKWPRRLGVIATLLTALALLVTPVLVALINSGNGP